MGSRVNIKEAELMVYGMLDGLIDDVCIDDSSMEWIGCIDGVDCLLVRSFVVDGPFEFLHLGDGLEPFDDVQVGHQHLLGDPAFVELGEGRVTV